MCEIRNTRFGGNTVGVCQKRLCFSISKLLLQTSFAIRPNFLNAETKSLNRLLFFLWASIFQKMHCNCKLIGKLINCKNFLEPKIPQKGLSLIENFFLATPLIKVALPSKAASTEYLVKNVPVLWNESFK